MTRVIRGRVFQAKQRSACARSKGEGGDQVVVQRSSIRGLGGECVGQVATSSPQSRDCNRAAKVRKSDKVQTMVVNLVTQTSSATKVMRCSVRDFLSEIASVPNACASGTIGAACQITCAPETHHLPRCPPFLMDIFPPQLNGQTTVSQQH
jgi:hypothetical protein